LFLTVDFTIALDAEAMFASNHTTVLGMDPGDMAWELAVDDCAIDLAALVALAPENHPVTLALHNMAALRPKPVAISGYDDAEFKFELADLLLHTYQEPYLQAMFKQLVEQLCLTAETLWFQREDDSSQPLAGLGVLVDLDFELLDELVSGVGACAEASQTVGDHVTPFKQQHCRSWQATSAGRLVKFRTFSFSRRIWHTCMRHHRVGWEELSKAKHISIITDGSRIANDDIMVFLLMVETPSGLYLVVIAPPMDRLWSRNVT
jgi:hypothetical protein